MVHDNQNKVNMMGNSKAFEKDPKDLDTRAVTPPVGGTLNASGNRVDDLIPETVSQLEGAVSIALVQGKPYVECDPAVIDCIVRHDAWRKDPRQGYIVYKNIRVYGKGYREESQRIEGLSAEDLLFQNSKGPGPETPFASAQAPKIEGVS